MAFCIVTREDALNAKPALSILKGNLSSVDFVPRLLIARVIALLSAVSEHLA